MRFFTAGITAFLVVCTMGMAAQPKEKVAAAKTPLPPRTGIKTPGVQIPFSTLTSDAVIPAPDNPGWTYFPVPAPAAATPAAAAPAGRGGRGGGGGGAGAGGGGAAGGGGGRAGGGRGGAAGASGGGGGGDPLYIPAADKLVKIEIKANKPLDPIASLKKPCGGMTTAFGSLWVPTCGDHSLQRIDARTGKITATIASGSSETRGSIAASPDSIWLLTDSKQTLSRIDPDQNLVVGELRVPPGCSNLIYAETSLWMTCPEQNKILRINPVTNVVDKRIEVGDKPLGIATGEGSIWVLCGKDGKIDRIDPKTEKVTKSIELSVPGIQGGIAMSDGYLWVTMTGFPITRVDPVAETVAQQFWGEGGGALSVSAGALWLSNLTGPNAGTVWRIDPKLILATLAE